MSVISPHASALRGIVIRLLVAAAILLALAVRYGELLVATALPWFAAVFGWIADDFKLLSLTIEHGADRVVKATVIWQHIQVIGGKVIYPDPRGTATASTLLAHALQGPLAAVMVACAWPASGRSARRWTEVAVRAVALFPMLLLMAFLDTPFVLAGELWSLVLDALDPQAHSLLVAWKNFLQGGGRHALGLFLGAVAVQGARFLVRERREAPQARPSMRMAAGHMHQKRAEIDTDRGFSPNGRLEAAARPADNS